MAPRSHIIRKRRTDPIHAGSANVRASEIDSERWAAVVARDNSFDGRFFFSVATTGVYCRPSCPSRCAKRENVAFHATRGDAEAAGFRPCRRCKPDKISLDEQNARLVVEACRQIEAAGGACNLDELATASGLSRFHFHRIFKTVTGVTPKAYAQSYRRQSVRRELPRSASVTEAIFNAGYNSSSRFYSQAEGSLGMTPKTFRAGGISELLTFAIGPCALGSLLVAASGKGIAAILIGDDAAELEGELRKIFPNAVIEPGGRDFEALLSRVIGLIEDPGSRSDLPLDIRGTAFQQRVWRALQEIPPGTTATYTEIAAKLGEPKAVRAVARACATNPLAIIVPCHRVVRADGGVAGYRWGIERKRALIQREADSRKKPRRRG